MQCIITWQRHIHHCVALRLYTQLSIPPKLCSSRKWHMKTCWVNHYEHIYQLQLLMMTAQTIVEACGRTYTELVWTFNWWTWNEERREQFYVLYLLKQFIILLTWLLSMSMILSMQTKINLNEQIYLNFKRVMIIAHAIPSSAYHTSHYSSLNADTNSNLHTEALLILLTDSWLTAVVAMKSPIKNDTAHGSDECLQQQDMMYAVCSVNFGAQRQSFAHWHK